MTVRHFMAPGGIKQLFWAALAALSLAACDPEPAPPEPPLTFGSTQWIGFEPFFTAEKMGAYDPERIRLVENPPRLSLPRALGAGTLDAAAFSLSRAMTIAQQGIDLTIVLVVDRSNGADVLLGHPSLSGLEDLRGKRIGAEIPTVNGYLLMRALQTGGLPFDAVTLVDMPDSQLADAYAAGQIDALSTFGGVRADALGLGAVELFSSRAIPDEILDVIVVRTDYLNTHPDHVADLIFGWMTGYLAVQTALGDPLKSFTPELVSASGFADALTEIALTSIEENQLLLADDGTRLTALMERRRAISAQLGLLGTEAPLPAVDPAPFLSALSRMRQNNPAGSRE